MRLLWTVAYSLAHCCLSFDSAFVVLPWTLQSTSFHGRLFHYPVHGSKRPSVRAFFNLHVSRHISRNFHLNPWKLQPTSIYFQYFAMDWSILPGNSVEASVYFHRSFRPHPSFRTFLAFMERKQRRIPWKKQP